MKVAELTEYSVIRSDIYVWRLVQEKGSFHNHFFPGNPICPAYLSISFPYGFRTTCQWTIQISKSSWMFSSGTTGITKQPIFDLHGCIVMEILLAFLSTLFREDRDNIYWSKYGRRNGTSLRNGYFTRGKTNQIRKCEIFCCSWFFYLQRPCRFYCRFYTTQQ